MSLLKGQALVTYTTLMITFDIFHQAPQIFCHFVARLQAVVLQAPIPSAVPNTAGGSPSGAGSTWKSVGCRTVRAYAAECLHEFENNYPCLLVGSLGEDCLKSTGSQVARPDISDTDLGSVRCTNAILAIKRLISCHCNLFLLVGRLHISRRQLLIRRQGEEMTGGAARPAAGASIPHEKGVFGFCELALARATVSALLHCPRPNN